MAQRATIPSTVTRTYGAFESDVKNSSGIGSKNRDSPKLLNNVTLDTRLFPVNG